MEASKVSTLGPVSYDVILIFFHATDGDIFSYNYIHILCMCMFIYMVTSYKCIYVYVF